jgi:hypothetical protein
MVAERNSSGYGLRAVRHVAQTPDGALTPVVVPEFVMLVFNKDPGAPKGHFLRVVIAASQRSTLARPRKARVVYGLIEIKRLILAPQA